MKGSITVYLALTLSCLTGFVLLLTGSAVRNANKIRMEGTVDMAMNSALGEFHRVLHERYGLLYIDLSYEDKDPTLLNLEERLLFYTEHNTNVQKEHSPWGSFKIKDFQIEKVNRATKNNGRSVKQQAINYRKDCGKEEKVMFGEVLGNIGKESNESDMESWTKLMSQIEKKPLPVIIDEWGNEREIPVNNPAYGVFAMTDSDLLWLSGVDVSCIGVGLVQTKSYSPDGIEGNVMTESEQKNTKTFVEYLFEKMGNYGRVRKESFLPYQLEYIAIGKKSDYENLKGVVEEIFSYRFSENVRYAFSDLDLYGQALEIAETLPVVTYDVSFREPIAQSLIYANAYVETLAELQCLMAGGRIQKVKSDWKSDWQQVIGAVIGQADNVTDGYSYEEYLFCLILQLPENTRNLRSMDIMEMDIRYLTGNIHFSMEECIERFTVQIEAEVDNRKTISLTRTYGYY